MHRGIGLWLVILGVAVVGTVVFFTLSRDVIETLQAVWLVGLTGIGGVFVAVGLIRMSRR